MEFDTSKYVKMFDIIEQAKTANGLMETLKRDVFNGKDGNYQYGQVPVMSTKTSIHNKIVILRNELHQLDEMIQKV